MFLRLLTLLAAVIVCPSAFAATNAGDFDAPFKCVEADCNPYRFVPYAVDANGDGVADGYATQSWTKSSAISTVTRQCEAGNNTDAEPDVDPVYSATGLPSGVSINSSTGSITGTPSVEGSGTATVTCANNLGSVQLALVWNVDESPSVPAAGYFVDCTNGNDSNTGLSHAQRWRTLSKVNSTVTAAGADVYLLDSSVCEDQTITVDWVGTAADRVVIGTYWMNGGTETVGVNVARAEINGTYDATCSRSLGAAAGSTCAMSTSGAVPSSQFNPLIKVSSHYVTIQDLILTESAGTGIGIEDFHRLTVDNVKFDITASLAIFPKRSQYLIVHGSEFTRTAIASSRGDQLYGGGPHAMSIQDMRPAYALIENNYFHDLYSEAVNCRTSSFCIFRGNRVANVKNIGIYLDNSSDSVVENNEIYGKTTSAPATSPGGGWNDSRGIYVAVEETSNPRYSTVRNVIRNNLIANVTHCLSINVFPTVEAEGWKTGGQFIGNTCLAFKTRAVEINDAAANIDGWEIANNIFDEANNGGASVCTAPTTALVNFHHNAWTATPGDTDCRGTGDVTGASGVSTSEDWTLAGVGHFPDASDWELTGTASADEVGDQMVATIVNPAASWLQLSSFSGEQVGGGTCDPSDANWEDELAVDIDCNVRNNPPDIGAKED